ncbi:MAG: hypothetical protein ACXABG_08760 [Promethearchaeota archaeon]|jgi:hypothetical protein
MFKYKKLGKFTYHVITDRSKIKPFLLKWIGGEWEIDRKEFPDQPWTIEWLNLLPRYNFKLKKAELETIQPRQDLMNYKTDSYSFIEELNERADEMEESILQGSSIGPLLVKKKEMELMDGYTRYSILKKYQQKKTYVYLCSTDKDLSTEF